MKKIIFASLLALAMCMGAKGQDLRSVLLEMPRNIIYGLTVDMKESLLNDPTDTTKFVSTAIYEKIERKAIGTDYILLKTSEVGTTEIKLLPLVNGSKIVCLIQSVCDNICDSKISFYTDKWVAIDGTELIPEKEVNWFIKEDADKSSEKYTQAINSLNMTPMKATFSADENAISITFDPKGFMSREDYQLLEPFLTKAPKVLKWDKSKFK